MAYIQLDQVRKIFPGGVVALQDLSLSVNHGELMVLLGPSGCGKTSTLRLIAGLEEPTGGTIRIGDQNVNRLPPGDRDVGFVFQNNAIYPHLTVRRNLSFALQLKKTPADEISRRVSAAAELLGIENLLDRKPAQLSGGELQRVAVGRVLVRQPSCALFDEPFSDLDASLRVAMRRELKQIHQKHQFTTLFVTHDQEEAMVLADRLAIMNQGRILQVGEPLEIFRQPANRFVADFLSKGTMNFLKGKCIVEDAKVKFVDGNGLQIPLNSDYSTTLRQHHEQPIVLGIRAEDVQFHRSVAEDSQQAAHIPGEIKMIEQLGNCVSSQIEVGGTRSVLLNAKTQRNDGYQSGDRVDVLLRADRIHMFEPGQEGIRINTNK